MITTIKHLLMIACQIVLCNLCGHAIVAIAWIGIEADNAELQRGDKIPISGYVAPLVEADWNICDIIKTITGDKS